MLTWLRLKTADGKFYCGEMAALPAAAVMKRAECAVIFDLSEDFNDRRAQHVRTQPRDSHFRKRRPVVCRAAWNSRRLSDRRFPTAGLPTNRN